MGFEWFKNNNDKSNLEKVVDESVSKIENDAELKLGHYKASQIPEDQVKNIEGQAEFFKVDLEPYSYYSKEVEARLGLKHHEIIELKQKIDRLEEEMKIETDYNKRKLIYQEIKSEIGNLDKMIKIFGDEDRESENN